MQERVPLPWQLVHATIPQTQTEEKKQHELKRNQDRSVQIYRQTDRQRQAEPYIETVWPNELEKMKLYVDRNTDWSPNVWL